MPRTATLPPRPAPPTPAWVRTQYTFNSDEARMVLYAIASARHCVDDYSAQTAVLAGVNVHVASDLCTVAATDGRVLFSEEIRLSPPCEHEYEFTLSPSTLKSLYPLARSCHKRQVVVTLSNENGHALMTTCEGKETCYLIQEGRFPAYRNCFQFRNREDYPPPPVFAMKMDLFERVSKACGGNTLSWHWTGFSWIGQPCDLHNASKEPGFIDRAIKCIVMPTSVKNEDGGYPAW